MAKKKLYSLNALAIECGRNFRTLSRALSDIRPDGHAKDGKPRWHLATAISALADHERRTGRVQTRAALERYDPVVEAQIHALEASGREVDALLAKLRAESSVERRRALIEGGAGKSIGRLERAFEATVTGRDAFLRRAFVDQQMAQMLAEIASLCEYRVDPL